MKLLALRVYESKGVTDYECGRVRVKSGRIDL